MQNSSFQMTSANEIDDQIQENDEPLPEEDLLEEILIGVVDHPNQVSVKCVKNRDRVMFFVQADPRDFGKIIGKSGSRINALREVLGMQLSLFGKQVMVNVATDSDQVPPRRSIMRANGRSIEVERY